MTKRGSAESRRREKSSRAVGFQEAFRYWLRLGFVLTAAAFAALYLLKLDAVWAVLAGGAVGLAYSLLK